MILLGFITSKNMARPFVHRKSTKKQDECWRVSYWDGLIGDGASLFVLLQTSGRAARRWCITFCVTTDGWAGCLAMVHHFLCYYRRLGGLLADGASLLVLLQTVGRAARRWCITFGVTTEGWRAARRWCITFCVTTDGWAGCLAMVHHFLCRYRRLGGLLGDGASLFVLLQTAGRVAWRWCITFCVTTDGWAGCSAMVHHFLCYYRRLGGLLGDGASLFVLLQTVGRVAWRWCITFCVTTDGWASCLAMVHHFLCYYRRLGGLLGDGASLFVLLQTVGRAARRWCITFCVATDGWTSFPAMVHHFWCHYRRLGRLLQTFALPGGDGGAFRGSRALYR